MFINPGNIVPISVTSTTNKPVLTYNLTVEGEHMYYANQVLVANCLTFSYPILARQPKSNLMRTNIDIVRANSPFKARRLAQAHTNASHNSNSNSRSGLRQATDINGNPLRSKPSELFIKN